MPNDTKTPPPVDLSLRGRNIGGQLVGAVLGAFVAFIVIRIAGQFGWFPGNQNLFLLIGAAVGSLLVDLERLEKAGSYLTRRTRKYAHRISALNVGAAILGMLVMIAIVIAISYLVLLLIR